MGRVKIAKSAESAHKDIVPFQVKMFGGAATKNGTPLYTYGFGPCMCLIIHNCGGQSGAMAHVAGNSYPLKHMSLLAKHMIVEIGSPESVEIIMLAGCAYKDGTPAAAIKDLQIATSVNPDYPGAGPTQFYGLFQAAMKPTASQIHFVDMRSENIAAALYLPAEEKVFYNLETFEFDKRAGDDSVTKIDNLKVSGCD